jgi:hypothetical protein
MVAAHRRRGKATEYEVLDKRPWNDDDEIIVVRSSAIKLMRMKFMAYHEQLGKITPDMRIQWYEAEERAGLDPRTKIRSI